MEIVMEVFVLMGGWHYEGDLLLGVYASEEEARTAHGVYTRDGDHYIDYFFIQRRVLGAPVDSDTEDRMHV
jgi:hypothetical protein